jgi:hypothetical protein
MSAVTRMRAEFFNRTGHKPALKPVCLPFLVARLVQVRFHRNSAVVPLVPASNTVAVQKAKRVWSEVQTLSRTTNIERYA